MINSSNILRPVVIRGDDIMRIFFPLVLSVEKQVELMGGFACIIYNLRYYQN
jgi:hypothetical protein